MGGAAAALRRVARWFAWVGHRGSLQVTRRGGDFDRYIPRALYIIYNIIYCVCVYIYNNISGGAQLRRTRRRSASYRRPNKNSQKFRHGSELWRCARPWAALRRPWVSCCEPFLATNLRTKRLRPLRPCPGSPSASPSISVSGHNVLLAVCTNVLRCVYNTPN